MEQSRIDWPGFGLGAAIIILSAVPLMVFPDESSAFLERLYAYIANEFGVLYLLASGVGYGAPAKGSTLLNLRDVGSDSIRYTVDRSPCNLDKLLPGTHIPELRVLE